MDRREFLGRGAAAGLFGGSLLPAWAQDGFVEGKHYVRFAQRLPVSVPAGKIEVIEFFWYGCPHCNAFEPTLEAWIKKLPPYVAFRRVHVGFRPSFEPLQRLYVTLETLGLVDTMQRKVFSAIHQQGLRLDRPEQITDFVVANGVDRAKFTEVYNSFGVHTRAVQGKALAEAYKIDGVPAIGIQGRYYTSPAMAGGEGTPETEGQQRVLQLTEQLVARIHAGG